MATTATGGVPSSLTFNFKVLDATRDKNLSALANIPLEIRRKIYANLLHADNVRKPPDRYLVASYHFHTAILLVNQKIYHEAREVLYRENQFITISSDWEQIKETCMTNHEVATVCRDKRLVAKFKENILRVHIRIPWANRPGELSNRSKGKVVDSFLILMQDLPSFTRMLNILDVTNNGTQPSMKLIFRIEGSPKLQIQKTLFEPFRRLTTQPQYVQFGGNIDAQYAKDLGRSIMPPLKWTRAAAWQLYNLAVTIKEVGDRALKLKNYDLAFAKYQDSQMVYKAAWTNNEHLVDIEDEGFHTSSDRLLSVCQTNITLITLKWALNPQPGESTVSPAEAARMFLQQTKDLGKDTASVLEKSRRNHYRGIALAVNNKDKAAFLHLRKAYELDPNNQYVKLDLLITKRRLAAKSEEEKSIMGKVTADRLPNDPLELDPPIITPSHFIAGERHLLRKFGYQGDMLDHIPATRGVDMKEMDQVMKNFEKQMEKAKGKQSIIWVGGGGW